MYFASARRLGHNSGMELDLNQSRVPRKDAPCILPQSKKGKCCVVTVPGLAVSFSCRTMCEQGAGLLAQYREAHGSCCDIPKPREKVSALKPMQTALSYGEKVYRGLDIRNIPQQCQ